MFKRNMTFFLTFMFVFSGINIYAYGINFELTEDNTICLDGDWDFELDGFNEDSKFETYSKMDKLTKEEFGGLSLSIPRDLEYDYIDDINLEYRPNRRIFAGWYKKDIELNIESSKRILVKFTGVSQRCVIWLNGNLVGKHYGMYDSFDVELTDNIIDGKSNEIIVYFEYPLQPKQWTYLGAQDVGHARPGIGIWGSVFLVVADEVFGRIALIDSDVENEEINVKLYPDFVSEGKYHIKYSIVDEDYELQSGKTGDAELVLNKQNTTPFKISISGTNIQRWSLDSPNLYYLKLDWYRAGKYIGSNFYRFGYRDFRTRENKFYLNDEPIYLKSMLMWAGHTNRGKTRDQAREKSASFVNKFKNKNLNHVRTAHSPAHWEFARVSDELGFLVYYEIGNCVFDMNHINNVAEELKKLVVQFYNCPSVVMYSLGNETWKTKWVEPKEVLYDAVKEINPNVLVTPVSGGHSWPNDPAKGYSGIDFYDIHNYSGHMDRPWNYMEESVRQMNLNTLQRHYGDIDKPMISGESIGLAWPRPPQNLRSNEDIYPLRYVELANSGFSPMWVSQFGTWRYFWHDELAGGTGQANYKINNRIAKLVGEQMRQMMDILQGINGWADTYSKEVDNIIFADVLASCWNINRNYYNDDVVNASINISNALSQELVNASLIGYLKQELTGEILAHEKINITDIEPASQERVKFVLDIPQVDTGFYKLCFDVIDASGGVISKNYYDIFILNRQMLSEAMKPINDIDIQLLYDKNERYAEILKKHNVEYEVSDNTMLTDSDIIIISFDDYAEASNNIEDIDGLRKWVEDGGRLLIDRLPVDFEVPFVDGFRAISARYMPSVELAYPQCSLFKNLEEDNFFFWNTEKGDLAKDCIYPLTDNVLLGKGFDRNYTMALSGFRIGKGAVVVNQLFSAENFFNDASAAYYTSQLLTFLSDSANVSELKEPFREGKIVAFEDQGLNPADVIMINLEPYANMAFTDKIAEDQKGGWTDQGELNLSMINSGVKPMSGVPFMIRDDEGGEKPAVIALYGAKRDYFPVATKRINVSSKLSDIYFLHTAAWINPQYVRGRSVMSYVITYEDGLSEVVPVHAFSDIGDWEDPKDMSNAVVGWTAEHPTERDKRVGVYVMKWENPKPTHTITNIVCRSEQTSVVPIVVAITGVPIDD